MPTPLRRRWKPLAVLLAATIAIAACGDKSTVAVKSQAASVKPERSRLNGSWPQSKPKPPPAKPKPKPKPAPKPQLTQPPQTQPPQTQPPQTQPPQTQPQPQPRPTVAPQPKPQAQPASPGPAAIAPTAGGAGPLGPPWPDHFTAADAIVPSVALYQAPGQPAGKTLSNPTWEGLHLVFLVRQDQGEWLQVQVPTRPNGATAWVKRSDVSTRSVPNHIVIERSARRITVYHGGQVILQDIAAVGKAGTPTPIGNFYVDGTAKPYNPNGPYGVYQVSFTGFSNVYSSFGGGVGEVAMHGTNQPGLLGTPASHGCVRLSNETVTRVVNLAPTGTPVQVVP